MSEFFLQGCSRAELRLSERPGDKFLHESVDHLPLFGFGNRVRGMPTHEARGAPDTAPLSMGHISSTSKTEPAAVKPKPRSGSERKDRIGTFPASSRAIRA